MKWTNITIIQEPVLVKFDCPHCGCESEISFSTFIEKPENKDWHWSGREIKCSICGKICIIDNVWFD